MGKHSGDFSTTVRGIPCQVEVTYVEPYRPARIRCDPDLAEPESGGYAEYRLLDRNGYLAEWLERKMTDADHDRVVSEILER